MGIQKIGNGLEAINFFEQGKLDELKKYCLKDVEITYKIYEHGRKFGFLKYINKWNNLKKIKVDFNQEINKAEIQMTLGG
ncbi:hypothetical protein A3J78_00840 [Candidatus Beckwithbacteria bacterium RBG_13_35_6]|uniref:Uncharacterized protein n=1 Tax=Candidatus Beckwithbacteria bacterium RBG_13_35_6 TaxID=1797456 RepID=A0A1F5DI44_9BACT|nr:MAG: hypothetical protein A3J78_00840 [Candidatus Beckwithbacteria bacterium RBG_13_35_6]